MSLFAYSAIVVAFLLTYLVHSTLLLTALWWLIAKRRWPKELNLRVQLLKLGLLLPVVTALVASSPYGPHWGIQWMIVGNPVAHEANPLQEGEGVLTDRDSGNATGAADSFHSEQTLSLGEDRDDSLTTPGVLAGAAASDATLAASPSVANAWRGFAVCGVASIWAAIVGWGLIRLGLQWSDLKRLRKQAVAVKTPALLNELGSLRSRFGITFRVELLTSREVTVPLAAGIWQPFVLFPQSPHARSLWGSRENFSAILAHELAHVVRRDAFWNLLSHLFCDLFFFQPLNSRLSREMRRQMEFAADQMAADALGERMSLVRCLYAAGDQLSNPPNAGSSALVLASGMASFESTLGQRVEALLNDDPAPSPSTWVAKVSVLTLSLAVSFAVSAMAPRALVLAANPLHSPHQHRNAEMNRTMTSLVMVAGLSLPVVADESKPTTTRAEAQDSALSTVPDELPAGMRQFNGMLVGRVTAKDVEQGTFIVHVDAVPRVWENSRAENPQSIVGKTVKVGGVFGKFLDVLVVTRTGETVEFECKHDGEGLVFPGELLRKVAPFDPADYPLLPDEFRGFRGQVAGEILKKDPETFELILRVDRVLNTWEENGAKNPKSIEGQPLMLAGFWNRRDQYHALKVGEKVELGMRHVALRSEHLNVADAPKRALSDRPANGKEEGMAGREEGDRKDPQRGFRGMLVGRLVEKDVERGTFTITVDAVPRVWENNKSANPKGLIGKKVVAEGVTGRMLDALVVTKVGETLEFGALNEEGSRIRVGEVLRKTSPVMPGDYPELPDDFRGFRGMATVKVIRKGDELWDMVVEIEKINETFENSRARKPQSIVGKQAMLAGFWNRKDEFHSIQVGDRVLCGINHPQLLSDHLTVIESIRKVEE
jgi:beta-lactamase regulating signal transducer with metallopeptidase domain